jgi:hypothetical protein
MDICKNSLVPIPSDLVALTEDLPKNLYDCLWSPSSNLRIFEEVFKLYEILLIPNECNDQDQWEWCIRFMHIFIDSDIFTHLDQVKTYVEEALKTAQGENLQRIQDLHEKILISAERITQVIKFAHKNS